MSFFYIYGIIAFNWFWLEFFSIIQPVPDYIHVVAMAISFATYLFCKKLLGIKKLR